MFDGSKSTIVRVQPLLEGYLWQAGKKYGFAEDLEEAQACAEGVHHQLNLEPSERWLSI